MLGGDRATSVAVCLFTCSEYAPLETWRTLEHFANTTNFDNVYADGNDHGS
jgi:hypothetical protein